MEDYWVWGSSVVKDENDGLFHMFVSRWPKGLPFHPGWMVASEVVHAISETPEGPYRFSDVALSARGAQYWDGRSVHNPRVVKYKDTYVMFYMGSTHPFEEITDPKVLTLSSPYTIVARSNKRIGIATSKSPYGPWVRRDKPVLETAPDTFYSFLLSPESTTTHFPITAQCLLVWPQRITTKDPIALHKMSRFLEKTNLEKLKILLSGGTQRAII